METQSRGTYYINFRVHLNPDDAADYIAYIKNNTTNQIQEVNLGYCEKNTENVGVAYFNGLTSNTSYTFSGTLSVKWPGYDSYTTGGATIPNTSITTWNNPPSNARASLSSDQNTLSVSWNQEVGGGASSITTKIKITSNQNYENIFLTDTFSGVTSRDISVSGLAPGTYVAIVGSANAAGSEDNPRTGTVGADAISNEFTITEQQVEPEPTITGQISSVQATASGTSATIAWTWTPGSSFRTSEYLYDYTVIYRVHGASVSTQKYLESSSSTRGNNTPKNFSVTLNSLQTGKTYDYWIQMSGKKSGGSESLIDTYGSSSFSTAGADAMTDPSVSSITETSAIISWKFTPGASSTNYYRGHIEIGSGSSYTGITNTYSTAYQGNSGQISFSYTASSLTAGQKYSYRITMESGSSSSSTSALSGSGFIKTGTFTTKSQAVSADGTISNVTVTFPSVETTAVVSWDWTPSLSEAYYYKGTVTVSKPDGSTLGSIGSSTISSSGETIHFSVENISNLESGKTYPFEIKMRGGSSESSLSDLGVTYSGNITPDGSSSPGGGSIDVSSGSMELAISNSVYDVDYSDGSNSRSASADVTVYWSGSTSINMNVRVFYSESSSVSNSNYLGYKDWSRIAKVTGETLFGNILIDGLDPEKTHYFKAYALTGSSYSSSSNFSVNTQLCSEAVELERVLPLIDYSTEPTVSVLPNANSVSISTQIKKANLYGLSNQYKVVVFNFPQNSAQSTNPKTLTAAKSAYGNRIIYEGSSTVMTAATDRLNVSTTVSGVPAGSYRCQFAVFYYDGSISDWKICNYVVSGGSRVTYTKEKDFSITGAVSYPTASWTTTPSISQTAGSTTIDYNAKLTRNDSLSGSYRMRIRLVDVRSNTDIVPGTETYVAKNGSMEISGTTSDPLSVGEYTFQFVAEWRSDENDTWKQVYTSGGTALSTNIQKTISGAPIGEWSSTPLASKALNGNMATYACTLQRVDVNSEDYYMRIRIVNESNGAVYTGADLKYAPNSEIVATGLTSELSTGSHSLTFIPEWRKNSSDTWNTVANSRGVSLLTTVPFEISSSGGGSGTDPTPITETIPLWSWQKSNNSYATKAQTKAAYDAIIGQMEPSNFKYQVWNSLLYYLKDKIELFGRTWWGSEKGSRYLNFNNALMTNSDKTLTAKRFMSFTYNILNLSYTSGKSFTKEFRSKERVKGQPVYGVYFIEATDAINDLITQINKDIG